MTQLMRITINIAGIALLTDVFGTWIPLFKRKRMFVVARLIVSTIGAMATLIALVTISVGTMVFNMGLMEMPIHKDNMWGLVLILIANLCWIVKVEMELEKKK